MSVIKYWPSSVVGLLALVAASLVAAVYGLVRFRTGVLDHWPYLLGVVLVLVGTGAAVAYANRPPFLKASDTPAGIDSIEEFEDYLGGLVAAGEPPGASVLVVKDGTVVYEKGFGFADGPRQVEATPDTVYRWWSVTKLVTAVATLQLAEQGRLDLDDPVLEHLPFFDVAYPTPDSRPVTVRHLLTHTSGLPDGGSAMLGWIHHDGDASRDQTELLREKLPSYRTLAAEPGREGRYTNVGYMVLAAVVEAVSGRPYEEYVTEHILRPLGMNDSGFSYEPHLRAAEATGSHPVDLMSVPVSFLWDMERTVRERAGDRLWFHRVHPDQTGPSGLIGSPRDLARFLAALAAEGEFGGVRILTPESVRAMNQRYAEVTYSPAPVAGFGFGFGWFHRRDGDGRVSLTHGGEGPGFVSMVRLYPQERLAVVVAANGTYLGRDFGLGAVDRLGSLTWQPVPR